MLRANSVGISGLPQPSTTSQSATAMDFGVPHSNKALPRTNSESNRKRPLVQIPESSRLDLCTVNDFELGVTCGTGSFSRVRHSRLRSSGEYIALKILRKSEVIRLKQVDHVISEKSILKCISHPFIVSLRGTFQDDHCLYFALEFVPGGEFFSFLRRSGRLAEENARFYAAQIVLIFEYLHKFKIAYRDLKPENILMDSRGYLKLTDFGFAKVVGNYTYTLCGTPEYISPEVLLNKGHSTPTDWWSLGIFIYEMIMGYPPFIADTTMGIYQKIVQGKVYFPASKGVSIEAKFLIRNLLTADLTKRFGNLKDGVDDIKFCDWFAGTQWGEINDRIIHAPYIPPLASEDNDTSNFEKYPDPMQDASEVTIEVDGVADVFVDW